MTTGESPVDYPDVRTADFDYELPAESIGQTPAEPRDSARLMVVERQTGETSDLHVRDLPDLLDPRDMLVVNNSRVLAARIKFQRPTGGQVEILLLNRRQSGVWEALVRPARKLPAGAEVFLPGNKAISAEILETLPAGRRIVRLSDEAAVLAAGAMPLPPYIDRNLDDPERYQTVYSREPGSAAAPTAGLHFSNELLTKLQGRGIEVHEVTLHVGLDTFRPVTEENAAEHEIHSEWCSVAPETAAALNAGMRRGGSIVAVGTTAVRTLESATSEGGEVRPYEGPTRLFILPGYRFRAVDVMMTNFHLPKSSLLMLVSAFASRERTLAAYRRAISSGYRFYSFGDAMLIR